MGCAAARSQLVQVDHNYLHEVDGREASAFTDLTALSNASFAKAAVGRTSDTASLALEVHVLGSTALADCFDVVREMVQLDPPKFSDSCVNPKILPPEALSEELKKCTECAASTYYMMHLFTGVMPRDYYLRARTVTWQHGSPDDVFSTDEEFCGSYENLMQMRADGTYVNSVIAKLFNQSKKNQHQLFCVIMGCGAHLFVVEKIGRRRDTYWRIYQSWASLFSLAEWLGIESWKCSDDDFTKRHSSFGNGKMLSSQEILNFFYHPRNETNSMARDTMFYVRVLDIDPNIRLVLQNKLIELGHKD